MCIRDRHNTYVNSYILSKKKHKEIQATETETERERERERENIGHTHTKEIKWKAETTPVYSDCNFRRKITQQRIYCIQTKDHVLSYLFVTRFWKDFFPVIRTTTQFYASRFFIFPVRLCNNISETEILVVVSYNIK